MTNWTPYQVLETFVALINPDMRKTIMRNEVLLNSMVSGYLNGLVDVRSITNTVAANAMANANWMIEDILKDMEANNAEAHA